MYETISLSCDDRGVTTLTLARPDKHNAMSALMLGELSQAAAMLAADDAVRVVILTGAGKAFSSGGDINAMKPGGGGLNAGLPAGTRGNYKRGIQRIPLAFAALEVPVIAAVNGPAIGAGLDLACMCDLRIAGESAKFAESFVKLGIIPGDGGAWLLQRAAVEGQAQHELCARTARCQHAVDGCAHRRWRRVALRTGQICGAEAKRRAQPKGR